MSLRRDLMDLEESFMRNDDRVYQSDYYTIVGLANDAQEIEQERDQLKAENANLRDALKALMVGTNAELCANRDHPQCLECSMSAGYSVCAMTVAMDLLGIDMYGEPVTYPDGEVDE